MNDLKNGIIKFGEITISQNTTIQEFKTCLADVISPASSETLFYLNKLLTFEGTRWGVAFTFANEKISSIQLNPYIQYKSEGWDRTGQQEERRLFCDQWLLERLGEPDTNRGGASYDYSSVHFACVTHFDIREGADAGYILISYK